MTEFNLEQIKKIAEKLSAEDRLKLFHYLSDLPDSGIESGDLSQPPLTLQGAVESNEEVDNSDNFALLSTETTVAVFLKGKLIFQVFYYPENFRESNLKVRSWQTAPPSERIMSGIRGALAELGIERTEEEITETAKQGMLKYYEAEIFRISNEISERLPHMTWLLIDATINIITIAMRNLFAEQTGQLEKKVKLVDMEKKLEPYWRHIKEHLGVTHGGARPRRSKFVWDAEKALKFYQTVEALPHYGADKIPMWEYARDILRDNDYDHETIQFLNARPRFADVPEGLLKEAASVWHQYDEHWDTLPANSSPVAFAFRHALHKLDYRRCQEFCVIDLRSL